MARAWSPVSTQNTINHLRNNIITGLRLHALRRELKDKSGQNRAAICGVPVPPHRWVSLIARASLEI